VTAIGPPSDLFAVIRVWQYLLVSQHHVGVR
jgi:hypothetical protein